MKNRFWGIIILLLVAAGAIGYTLLQSNTPDPVSITGYLGGEKKGLYDNPKFQEYLDEEYGITMDYHVLGSYNMVQGNTDNQDYLFPSSQLALELYESLGRSSVDDEIVLNSPIVLYSRKLVVDALITEGIVEVRDGIHYVDMEQLARLIADGAEWQDIGLPQLHDKILVDTTDPNLSNSGNMFLGVLANALNGNQPVNMNNVSRIEADIQRIYQTIGFMNTSSSDMFSQFLRQGVGAFPIIAGYESQILEFSIQSEDIYNQVSDDIYILYPEPTVWSSHVYIALTDEGDRAIEALMDPVVQTMAWEEHGYRTMVAGTADTTQFSVPGLAKDVTQIMSMPDIDTMLHLMDLIK